MNKRQSKKQKRLEAVRLLEKMHEYKWMVCKSFCCHIRCHGVQ